MAVTFPTSPTNGQTFTANGLSYVYNATYGVWRLNVSTGSSGGTGGGVTTYATVAELPLTGNSNGDMAFVEETDRLYLSNDNGWFNIALINTSPTITQGGAGSYALAADGTPTVITLTATDPEEVPLTWSYSVTSGALGTTATVTQADNVFTITPGTDAANDAGTFEITFSVTDGTNIVSDVNSFSLVFSTLVQNSNYTIALITTDGSTGNNTTFVDSSTNGATITASGNPKLTTYSPYRDGGYSVKIDATAGSWIYANSHSDFNFGTGDFTVEFWMKSQKSDQWLLLIDQQYQAQGISIWVNPTNQLIYYPNSSTPALTSQALPMTDWIHVALVRSSGTTKFYVNGVWNSTSYSDSQNFNTNLPFKMGSDYSPASYGYLGFFRDVRVTDTAVYSADFTPPTEPLTEISGTKLLTCQSSNFKDVSTTPHTITVVGSPSIVPYGPYDYDAFDPQLHGGSVYFDGSNYLQAPYHSSFDYNSSTPFTIDMWFYPLVSSTDAQHIASSNTSGVDAGLNWLFRQKADNTLRFVMIDGSGTVVTCDSTYEMKINAWNHVAVIMTGSSIRHWLNGTWQQEVSFSGTQQVNGNIDIGRWGSTYYNGYVSDFRYNVGEELYTGVNQFSVPIPTEPLSSTNSELHIKGTSANIIDKSQSTIIAVNSGYADDGSYGGVGPKYAGTSIYNTSNNSLTGISFTLPVALDTDDFTIEGWLRWITNGSWDGCFFQIGDHTQSSGLILNLHNPNPVIRFGSSNTYVDNTTTLTSNQWYHIAVTRESGVCKIWLDGQLEGSRSTPENITATTGYILSATYNNSGIVGHVEDFRITKGLARYTANFTPPTASLDG
jgi:hypothetical protein